MEQVGYYSRGSAEPFRLPQNSSFEGGDSNKKSINNKTEGGGAMKKAWESIPLPAKSFMAVSLLFVVLLGMTKLVTDKTPRYDKKMIEGVSKIVKDLFEYQKLAQKLSPTDPLRAFEKTLLAQGNLSALKRLMPESEIVRLTGIDVRSLEKTLEDLHERLRTVLAPMDHDSDE